MKLFVPEIGSKLKITSDWSFILYPESRNDKMFKAINKPWSYRSEERYIITIPKDTILGVDRVYIRKGVSDYSSVTFTIPKDKNKKNKYAGTRFWAKLSDVNKIEFELLSCNENTMVLIRSIDEKTKLLLSSIDQSKFMSNLLGGQTINNIRPQEQPDHFILKLKDTLNWFKTEFINKRYHSVTDEVYSNLEKEMNMLLRQYKIASFINED